MRPTFCSTSLRFPAAPLQAPCRGSQTRRCALPSSHPPTLRELLWDRLIAASLKESGYHSQAHASGPPLALLLRVVLDSAELGSSRGTAQRKRAHRESLLYGQAISLSPCAPNALAAPHGCAAYLPVFPSKSPQNPFHSRTRPCSGRHSHRLAPD